MEKRIRTFDWANTPLGPRESWPLWLETALAIVLGSRQPMFLWWGPDFIHLYNDSYRPFLGQRHPDALGRPAAEVWSDIWEVVGPLAEGVRRDNHATWNEDLLLVVHRHGYPEEAYFTFSYSPVPDDHGGVGAVLCTGIETTARVLGERRLDTLRQLSAIPYAASAAHACENAARVLDKHSRDIVFALIYLVAPDGSEVRLHGASGLKPGDAGAPEVISLAPRNGNSPWPLAGALSGRTIHLADLDQRMGASESSRPGAARVAALLPLKGSRGQTMGVLIAGISPLRPLDEDCQAFLELVAGTIATTVVNASAYEHEHDRAEALVEIDRTKNAFLSNISHELRTPLTLLLGPLEEELQHAPNPSPNLVLAARSGRRLNRLVDALLDFSRSEAGRGKARFFATDLAAFTTELASSFRSSMQIAGLDFVVDCRPLSQPAYIDRAMWEKIVTNLLGNAFKFTLEGSVEVRLRERDGRACLTISDTGVGIPAEELPRVFQRFHRARSPRARSHEGAGIGLALARQLVRIHGGEIEVASVEDRGTTFTILLPLGSGHLPSEQIVSEAPLPAGGDTTRSMVEEITRWIPEATPPAGPAGARPGAARVLIVDAHPDMRSYLRRLLAPHHEVELAADGEAAFAAIARRLPDLVLSDVTIPGSDGFELLRHLRSDELTRSIPVILLSARAGEDARVQGLDAGADDYLVKPFGAQELLARIRSQLELARLRRESADRVSRILENITDGFHTVDATGRYTFFNPAARAFFTRQGMEADSLLGRKVFETFPEFLATPGGQALKRTLDERVSTSAETEFPGWNRWYSIRNQPLPDGGAATFIQEVTVQKLAEERLRQAHTELEAVYAQSPVGMAQFDADLRYVRVNNMLASFNGFSPAEHIGREFREIAPIAAKIVEPHFRHVLTTGEPLLNTEFSCPTPITRGEVRTWRASCYPHRNSHRRIIGVNINVEDITAQKNAERALRASEDRYRAFIANSTEGIWRIEFDPPLDTTLSVEKQIDFACRHGRFAECNEAMARMHGLDTADQFVGRPLDFMLPANDPKARAYLGAIIRAGYRVTDVEFTARDAAGRLRHFANSVAGVSEYGILRTLWGTQRDVTESKIAEEALRSSEERFRLLASLVTDVPWLADPDGRFITPQLAWENYTGQPWQKHAGLGWLDAIHPEDRRHVLDDWTDALRRRSVYRTQGRIWHAVTRSHRHFTARATPLLTENGEVREWIGTYTDVHEERVAAERLEALVAERTAALEDKIAEVETFSYSIAHDMRAPLRSMRGFADILIEEFSSALDPEACEYLRRIAASASRMDKLIQDILGYSRVMQGAAPRERVDLEELLRGMIQSYPQLAADKADIEIVDRLPAVLGSEAMFTQVFSNLLGNAVKFVAPGVRPHIRVQAEPASSADRVRVLVRDNGIGIAEHQHDKIFAIFQQVDRSAGGTGIGLAIVRKAMERMGGGVAVESTPSEGSTFIIEALVARAAD